MKNFYLPLSILIALSLTISSCGSFSVKDSIKAPTKSIVSMRTSWAKNLDTGYNTGNLPIALNAPLIFEGIVYAGDASGMMHAYNLVDGRELWSTQERGAFHSAPVALNDLVIYGTVEGRVVARNRMTGKLKYELSVGSAVESQGVLSDGFLFFHLRGHQIICLDAKTGKLIWSYKRAVPFITTLQGVSKPVILQDKLYVGFADSYLVAFSKVDGNLIWEKKLSLGQKFIDVDITPTFFQGKLVTASSGGTLQFINPQTGMTQNMIDILPSTTPIFLPQGMLVGTVDGEIVLVNKNLKIIYRKKIAQGSISSFSFWKDSLLVGTTDGYLVELDQSGFEIKSRRHLGSYASAIFSPPAVWKNYVALITSRYRLYLFN